MNDSDRTQASTGSRSVDSFISDVGTFAQQQAKKAAAALQVKREQVIAKGGTGASVLSALGLAQQEGSRAAAQLQAGLVSNGLMSPRRGNLTRAVTLTTGLVLLGGVSYIVYSRYLRPQHRRDSFGRGDAPPPQGDGGSDGSGSGVHRLLHRTSKSISLAWAQLAPRFGADDAPTSGPSSASSASSRSSNGVRRFFSSFSLPFSGNSNGGMQLPAPEDIVGCAYIQLALHSKPPLRGAAAADTPADAASFASAWSSDATVGRHLAAIEHALRHAQEHLLIGLETDTRSYTVDELNEMLALYYNAVAAIVFGKLKREPTFAFTFLLPLPSTSAALAESSAAAAAQDGPNLSQALACDLLLRVAALPDLDAVLFEPAGLAEALGGGSNQREAFMGALKQLRAERGLPEVLDITLEGLASSGSIPEESAAAAADPAVPAPALLQTHSDVVLGGTFDHLHIGHMILLTVAALLSTRSLVIGLTVDAMLQHKANLAHMESWTSRLHSVLHFLSLVAPGLAVDLVPLHDMYGPSGDRAELTALVVSEETVAGGPKVNEKRRENHLQPLDIVVVKLAKPAPLPGVAQLAADKISSTTLRQWDADRHTRQQQFLTQQWESLASALRLGGDLSRATFDQLSARYNEPHRAYHTLEHVETLLHLAVLYRARMQHPEEVALAIWFHDAVYETPGSVAASAAAGEGEQAPRAAGQNERDSEALFRQFAQQAGLSAQTQQRVSAMILATIRHQLPGAAAGDASAGADHLSDLKLFLDFDLSILASNEASYSRYTAAIRHEYIHYPLEQYLRGRLAVLHSFAQRETLFFTPAFKRRAESRARFNIANEIQRIQAAPELQQN